jgi:hypothetical protein
MKAEKKTVEESGPSITTTDLAFWLATQTIASDHVASIGAVMLLLPSLIVIVQLEPVLRFGVASRILVGFAAFFSTVLLVPTLGRFCERKGIWGRDLGKRFIPGLCSAHVPSALGIVSAIAYMICIIGCEILYAKTDADRANFHSALTSVSGAGASFNFHLTQPDS